MRAGKQSLKDQIDELKQSLGANLFKEASIPEELSLKELIDLALVKLDEFDKLKIILSLHLDNADRYLSRGKEKLYIRDYEGAIKEFLKAIELDPDYTEAKSNLEIAKKKLEETNNQSGGEDSPGE